MRGDGGVLWAAMVVIMTALMAVLIATGDADLSWWLLLVPVLFVPALYAAGFIVLVAFGLPFMLLLWILSIAENICEPRK